MPRPVGAAPEAPADASILEAVGPEALADVRALLAEYGREYAAVGGPDFGAAVARMPERCAPPEGCLLLARWGAEAVGCVGLAPRDGGACELLRLYVRPARRGHGVGRELMERALDAARRKGYRRAVLGTLPAMTGARALYAALGFAVEAAPPADGTPCILRMGRTL